MNVYYFSFLNYIYIYEYWSHCNLGSVVVVRCSYPVQQNAEVSGKVASFFCRELCMNLCKSTPDENLLLFRQPVMTSAQERNE